MEDRTTFFILNPTIYYFIHPPPGFERLFEGTSVSASHMWITLEAGGIKI